MISCKIVSRALFFRKRCCAPGASSHETGAHLHDRDDGWQGSTRGRSPPNGRFLQEKTAPVPACDFSGKRPLVQPLLALRDVRSSTRPADAGLPCSKCQLVDPTSCTERLPRARPSRSWYRPRRSPIRPRSVLADPAYRCAGRRLISKQYRPSAGGDHESHAEMGQVPSSSAFVDTVYVAAVDSFVKPRADSKPYAHSAPRGAGKPGHPAKPRRLFLSRPQSPNRLDRARPVHTCCLDGQTLGRPGACSGMGADGQPRSRFSSTRR